MIETGSRLVNNELIDEVYAALGDETTLANTAYNIGYLDGSLRIMDDSGVTKREYKKVMNKILKRFDKIRKQFRKLLKKGSK